MFGLTSIEDSRVDSPACGWGSFPLTPREPAGLALRRTDRRRPGSPAPSRPAACKRGDVVMTPGRQPDRVGALACSPAGGWGRWRCPAHRAAPARPRAPRRRRRPELCVGEEALLGEDARRACRPRPSADVAASSTRTAPRRPGGDRGDGARGPGADRLHLRHHRRAARRRPRLPLPARAARPGRALVRLAQGRARLVHDATGWSKSARNVFLAPWLDRRRRGHPRRPLRPGRAARLRRGARRQRPLPGADRVPDAGPAHRAAAAAGAAADGLGRRAARPGDDRRLPRGDRASSRPTATARPRPARSPATSPASRSARARWASRCRASRPGSSRANCSCAPPPPPPSSPATSTASASRASGGRPATWSATTRTATSLRGPRRRHHPLLRLPDRPDRGRVRPALPPRGRRCRRRRRPDPERGSVVRAIVVLRDARQPSRASWPASCRSTANAGPPLQVPPHRRVRRRAAEDQQRQDQARRAARRRRAAPGLRLGATGRPRW